MTEMIEVWLKEPGMDPEKKFVPNTLEFLQWYVEGYIEAFTLESGMVVVCNEEGKLEGLPYNCTIAGEEFVGKILIVGQKEDEFDDCSADEQTMRELFPQLWENAKS